jgi:hypothetical protein
MITISNTRRMVFNNILTVNTNSAFESLDSRLFELTHTAPSRADTINGTAYTIYKSGNADARAARVDTAKCEHGPK